MLLLMFQAAGNAYAVAAECVVEVVPRIALRALPHAPDYLAGLFSYRGHVVPALDLGRLLGGPACRSLLSTRIVVAACPRRGRAGTDLLGLIAEQVNDVRKVSATDLAAPAVPLEQAPYLGPIVRVDAALVQCLDVARLVPESLLGALFGGE